MNDPEPGLVQSAPEEILTRLNHAGGFSISVLASPDGLPIAAAPRDAPHDADVVAAMVTMARDFIRQTQEQLALPNVDEVSIIVGDRTRLVCRYFEGMGQPLILAIIAPPDARYRRATTKAISELRAAW